METGAVAASQSLCHDFGGRLERSEFRMFLRKVVHPSRKAADCSFPSEAVKRDVHRFPAAQMEKIDRNENRTTTARTNSGKYLRINALRRLSRIIHVRNNSTYFLHIKSLILKRQDVTPPTLACTFRLQAQRPSFSRITRDIAHHSRHPATAPMSAQNYPARLCPGA